MFSKLNIEVLFLYSRKLIQVLLSLGTTAVLARQLSPQDFGIVAIANALIQLNLDLGQSTIGKYIISLSDDYNFKNKLNSAFWFNTILTLLFSLLYYQATFYIKFYFEYQNLDVYVRLLIISLLFNQISSVPNALLEKKMKFRAISIRDSILNILMALLTIFMVLNNYSIWSLIIPRIVISPFKFFTTFYTAKWLPSLNFEIKNWGEIYSYILPLVGNSFIRSFNSVVDKLFLGTNLGIQNLGYYSIADNLSSFIYKNIINPLKEIYFPYMKSKKNFNNLTISKNLGTYYQLTSFVIIPITLLMIIKAEIFMNLLYGSQWSKSIIIFIILSPLGLRKVFAEPNKSLFLLKEKQKTDFKINFVFSILYMIVIFHTSKLDLVSFTLSLLAIKMIQFSTKFYFVRKMLNLDSCFFLNNTLKNILIAVTSLIPLILFSILEVDLPQMMDLLINSILYFLLYLLLHNLFKSQSMNYLKNKFK